METKMRKIGRYVLALGILLLVAGLAVTILVGTIAAPILLFSSIIINSVGITLMRHQKDRA